VPGPWQHADGESVRTVAELVGHSKTSTTWDTDGHVAVETQRAAVQRLSSLLSG
jgi:site-specific recombinase XerD